MNKVASELITSDAFYQTDRLPVPGGWIYRTFYQGVGAHGGPIPVAIASTFVPFPAGFNEEHRGDLEKLTITPS